MTDDLDFIIQTGERLGCENIRLLGKGYFKAFNALGKDEALDAAVDAFVGACRYFDSSRGKFTTIAYTCMNSAIIKRISHRKTYNARGHRKIVNEGDPDLLQWSSASVVDSNPGPQHQAALNEIAERVRLAFKVLPQRHATVIRRIYFDGESASDVARSMGVSRQRINQIVEKGHALMKPYLEGLS